MSASPPAADAAVPGTVDVAIVGAGVIGASIAYWLTRLQPGLSVVLVERDPGFADASSQRSASSIRQQFGTAVNVAMSRFGLEFLREAETLLEVDGRSPGLGLALPGYLYLATDAQADALRAQNALQRAHGAPIELLDAAALADRFPWLNVEDLALGSHGPGVEGWFDGPALHAALLRRARAQGARLLRAEVAAIALGDGPGARRATGLRLADGTTIRAHRTVLAAGAWSRALAATAGLALPVHARRRTVFVFSCPTPLPGCPLVIDTGGFWFRPEGRAFIGGAAPADDVDDLPLEPDHAEFDEAAWTALAHRVPAFEALRVERAWAGYYEMNLWDHNALLGEAPDVPGLLVAAGFSGHGMQQAPAAGRGIAERVLHGRWTSLDLDELSVARIAEGRRVHEANVIG
ncbi:MAG TPA: FAD-dependent oxidoreductase [Burkholderiaceae bacterium]|nr:FAD-dependent oxidoreductase [Burkholderiaceae bacterium]